MNTRILFIHAWTPLHAGTGQSIGAIDLTIARETATGIPYLPGSSLKGVLRDRANTRDREHCNRLFGPPPESGDEHAGSLHFGDARLVCMPVRSLAGTFCHATSPYLLERLARDFGEVGIEFTPPPTPSAVDQILVGPESSLLMDGDVVLEDLQFKARKEPSVDAVAKLLSRQAIGEDSPSAASFPKRLAIVHDDVMAYLLEQATEVRARIRIDEQTKTVQKGALWYEEALPAEALLASLIVAQPPKKLGLSAGEVFEGLEQETQTLIQLGGNATIGRGQCKLQLVGGPA